MKKYAMVIDVPSIDEGEAAYNHDRPFGSLLMHQIRHLHAAEQHLPPEDRTGVNITQLHTELDASTYIGAVTEKLKAKGPNKSPSKPKTPQLKAKTAKKKPVKPAKKRKR